MNIALILSGGVGHRLGADVPKQYLRVGGKTIISYCMETFEKCQDISAIQIVAEESWRNSISDGGFRKLRGFSKPGENRQLSILNGLRDICTYASEDDIVIIHDAARPLVSEKMLVTLIEAAKKCDGAIPILPMKDTVYLSEEGRITSLLDRNRVVAGQAPESFVLGKYYQANLRLLPDEIRRINGSTEPAILAGLDVAVIEGEEQNFKITTKEDLKRFQELVSSK